MTTLDVDALLAFDDCPLIPFEDRVVIVPDPPTVQTIAGLVIPFAEGPFRGTVIAVGPGRVAANGTRIPVDVAPGDRVEIPQIGGTDVNVDGVDYHLITAPMLLAVER